MFSPVTFALLSMLLPLAAFLIPERTYENLLGEPKFVGLQILLYIGASLGLFLLGFSSPRGLAVSVRLEEITKSKRALNTFVGLIVLLLMLVIFVNLYSIAQFASQYGIFGYWQLFVQGEFASGGVFTTYTESVAGVSWILLGAPPVILMGFWINWRSAYRIVPWYLLYSALALSVIRPLLRGDRAALLQSVFPLVLTGLYFLYTTKRLTFVKAILGVLATVVFAFITFVIFQISRSGVSIGLVNFTQINLFGYAFGGYNRFAVQMAWDVPLPPSHGYYTLAFVEMFPILNKLLPLETWVRSLTEYVPPISTFALVGNYGLNPNYNVVTAFGNTYLDFGWLGPLLFVPYGFLVRVAYNSLRAERAFGIMTYGPIIFTIVEWRGKLEITWYNFTAQLLFVLLIAGVGFVLRNLSRNYPRKRSHDASKNRS